MSRVWTLGMSVCAAVALSSCVSGRPRLQEVPVPPQRIVQRGYSVVPLNENGWAIVERDPVRLSLGKTGETADATIIIRATLFRLPSYQSIPEFVQLIKDGQAKDTDPQRFKVLKHEVTVFSGKRTDCARSHMVAEDHAALKRSRNAGLMILEVLTLTCAHPEDKRIGVDIGYSQRYYAEQRDPEFLDKASTVLASIEFTSF